ncbi:hypothetical protein I3842_08G177600 [Carya illinoinensis]|uniref:Uncharacterized protein n=1 Tax=Carya illinoinensis TaxID=32201 RepID=A0A922EGQ5_CARIL|nr:hypothetical protein I3842_08G177600 [Carya illinoinensis]
MSDSKEKKKENEESAQEDEAVTIALPNHKAAQADEHEDHDSSVPLDQTLIQTLNGTPPLPEDNKIMESWSNPEQPTQDSPDSPGLLNDDKDLLKPNTQPTSDVKIEDNDLPPSNLGCVHRHNNTSSSHVDTAEPDVSVAKDEPCQVRDTKLSGDADTLPATTTGHNEPAMHCAKASDIKSQIQNGRQINMELNGKDVITPVENGNSSSKHFFLLGNDHLSEGNESGTEEEQSAFMKELEIFFRERSTEFKPPKTCTTVSWTFRGFYEKALLSYERHKAHGGELNVPIASHSEPMNIENQASGSGRARRDAAARAMQGWHSQRLLGNGEVSDPIIKDKNSISMQKREKQLKNIGLLKRKKPSYMEHTVKAARTRASKPQLRFLLQDNF